jgi:hypothetical protein
MRLGWIVVFAGCATESWYELGTDPGPTAVGARVFAGVSSGNCHAGERASHCSFDTVTIDEVTLGTAGIFERSADTNVAIDLLAVAEGTTRMTVVADNGDETKEFVTTLSALAADRVTVTPTLRDQPCVLPARYAIGFRPTLPTAKFHGDTPLHGRYYNPFDITGGATLDVDRSRDGDLVMQLSDTPATLTLTSPVDASFSLTLETFAPSQVEAVVIGDVPSTDWFPLSVTRLPIDIVVGGAPVCGDSLSRTARTSGVCKIYEEDGDGASDTKTIAGMSTLLLRAYQSGTCTVEVSLDGTALTATKTLTVLNR